MTNLLSEKRCLCATFVVHSLNIVILGLSSLGLWRFGNKSGNMLGQNSITRLLDTIKLNWLEFVKNQVPNALKIIISVITIHTLIMF